MAFYDDPVKMVRDIRSHVFRHTHRVIPTDNRHSFGVDLRPIPSKTFGYTCMGCLSGDGVEPQIMEWFIDSSKVGELEEATLLGVSLHGILEYYTVRERLTDYLNGLELDIPRGPVIDRYHRPWVI